MFDRVSNTVLECLIEVRQVHCRTPLLQFLHFVLGKTGELQTCYRVTHFNVIELPPGKTWENVKEHAVKWGTLYLTFDDGTELEIEDQEDHDDNQAYKRPVRYAIYSADDDGEITDWDKPLAEYSI